MFYQINCVNQDEEINERITEGLLQSEEEKEIEQKKKLIQKYPKYPPIDQLKFAYHIMDKENLYEKVNLASDDEMAEKLQEELQRVEQTLMINDEQEIPNHQ